MPLKVVDDVNVEVVGDVELETVIVEEELVAVSVLV